MKFLPLLLARILAFCTLVTAVSVANAQTCERTVFKYVNGVLNLNPEAAAASAALMSETLRSSGINEPVRFLWNPSSLLADFLEVGIGVELLAEWYGSSGSAFVDKYWEFIGTERIARAVNDAALNPVASASIQFRNIVNQIKSSITNEILGPKRPVVLIAHSQGNIYVNRALQELRTEPATANTAGLKAVGIVGLGVAALANSVPSDHYRYTTFAQDNVINALRLLANLVPPNYVIEAGNSPGVTNHKVEYYLSNIINLVVPGPAGDTPRDTFVRNVVSVRAGIESEWPCLTDVQAPTLAQVGQAVPVSARFVPRPGDTRTITGFVRLELGPSACTSSVGPGGLVQCAITAELPTGLQTLSIRSVLASPFAAANDLYFNFPIGTIDILQTCLNSNPGFTPGTILRSTQISSLTRVDYLGYGGCLLGGIISQSYLGAQYIDTGEILRYENIATSLGIQGFSIVSVSDDRSTIFGRCRRVGVGQADWCVLDRAGNLLYTEPETSSAINPVVVPAVGGLSSFRSVGQLSPDGQYLVIPRGAQLISRNIATGAEFCMNCALLSPSAINSSYQATVVAGFSADSSTFGYTYSACSSPRCSLGYVFFDLRSNQAAISWAFKNIIEWRNRREEAMQHVSPTGQTMLGMSDGPQRCISFQVSRTSSAISEHMMPPETCFWTGTGVPSRRERGLMVDWASSSYLVLKEVQPGRASLLAIGFTSGNVRSLPGDWNVGTQGYLSLLAFDSASRSALVTLQGESSFIWIMGPPSFP